jgi:hypothetical protein
MSKIMLVNRRHALAIGAGGAVAPLVTFTDDSVIAQVAIAQPALSIEQPVSGLKPVFNLDVTDLQLNDVLRLQRATNNTFTTNLVTVNTTVTQTILNNGFQNLATYSVPAAGTYFFRAYHLRGATSSAASTTISQAFTNAPLPNIAYFGPTVLPHPYSSTGAVSFSAVSVPNAATSRVVQVWIVAQGDPGIKVGSAIINGVARTPSFNSNQSPASVTTGYAASVYNLSLPTGTSLTASTQFVNASNVNTVAWRAALIVVEMVNANATATENDVGLANGAVSLTTSTSTTIPTGGVAVSMAYSGYNGGVAPVWTNGGNVTTVDLTGAGVVSVGVNIATATATSVVQPSVTYAQATTGQMVTVAMNNL